MTKLLETNKSFLVSHNYTNQLLLKKCVDDVTELLLEYPKIIIYGKECTQHRSVGFFADPKVTKGYCYSRKLLKSVELTDNLQQLLNEINSILDTDFNGILVNKYKDGNDYISSHSDDESGISDKGVVSISYGAIRKFRIRNKNTNKIVKDINLNPYQIIHMGGNFQKEFKHEVPIQKLVKEPRYSFTFRKHTE